MPETSTRRKMTGAEKQAAYMARLKGAHYERVPDELLLREAARRGLIPATVPDTGTGQEAQ